MESYDYLKVIKKYAWLILLLTILSAASAWAVSTYVVVPKYASNAMVIISYSDAEVDSTYLNAITLPDSNSVRLFYNIAESDTVAQETIDALQLNMKVKDMHKLISADVDYDTGILSIEVTTENAEKSKNIIDTYINTLEKNLGNLFEDLRLYIMDEPKVADEPASPNIPLNIALSAVGGMMTAALFVILSYMKEQTNSDLYALCKFPQLFVLGFLPKATDKAGTPANKNVQENLRIVGTNVQLLAERNTVKTALITSPKSKEDNSGVSLQIASTIAKSNKRVLLVDCNIEDPLYYKIETLRTAASKRNAHRMVGDNVVKYVPDFKIDMMVLPHDAAGIQFENLRFLFESMEQYYDMILIDCPPILLHADTMMLANIVKKVILVGDYQNLNCHTLEKCTHRLEQIDASVLGIVVNRTPLKKIP